MQSAAGPQQGQTEDAVKRQVQLAWNLETRVTNYVARVALKEFGDGPCREIWRETLRRILPEGKLRILDIGCGPGVFTQVCTELGHDVTGMDFSERMIATARSLAEDRGLACTFIYGDAEQPPLPPASFDVVLSRRLLFNLPDPARAFAAWRDLVVPGGMVISMDSDPSDLPAWLKTTRRWAGKALARLTGYQKAPQPWRMPDRLTVPKECFPLLSSPSEKVRPMMEAQGLVNIELLYAQEVRRIRNSMDPFIEQLLQPPSRPYILIGRRPKP
jgi:SAM-dependent methyltransferase